MRKSDLDRVLLAVFVCSLCVGPVLAAPPTPIDMAESVLEGPMGDAEKKKIAEWTDYWSKQVIEAKDKKAVDDARTSLIEGYGKYPQSQTFRAAYAAEAARGLAAVTGVDAKDTLKTLKYVAAGVVLTRMPQIGIAPALDKLAVSDDVIGRYYAWTAYGQIRQPILADAKVAQTVYTTLTTQMAKEKSAGVLAAMVEFLDLGGVDLASLNANVKKLAVDGGFATLAKNWPTLCEGIKGGSNTPMVDAGRNAIRALLAFQKEIKDEKSQAQMLQMTVDLMSVGGTAYLDARKKAQSTGATQAENVDRYNRLKPMLEDCEAMVNTMAPDLKRPLKNKVTAALRNENDPDPGAAVQGAVLDVIEELAKTKGVKAPK